MTQTATMQQITSVMKTFKAQSRMKALTMLRFMMKITESRGQHLSGSPGGEHSLGNQRGLNFSEIFQAFDPPFSQKPLATQNTVT